MAKVLGIGGIFFKSTDPKKLGEWYKTYLGLDIDPAFGGAVFHADPLPVGAYSVWAPFKKDTSYFEPSGNSYMINFIVDDLAQALRQVEEGGATLHGEPTDEEYGTFGWFTDPEDNKIELWQPKPVTVELSS